MSSSTLEDFLKEQVQIEEIIVACASQREIRLMPSAAIWNAGSMHLPSDDDRRVVEIFSRNGRVTTVTYWKWELDATSTNHFEHRILRALAGL